VLFALQNNALVTVTVALWHFESTLAVVLLLAIGLGVLVAGLEKARLEQCVAALEAEAACLRPPSTWRRCPPLAIPTCNSAAAPRVSGESAGLTMAGNASGHDMSDI
jgi:hypothetical protein